MMNLILQGVNWGIIGGVAVVVGTATIAVITILGLMAVGFGAGAVEFIKIIYYAIKAAIKK